MKRMELDVWNAAESVTTHGLLLSRVPPDDGDPMFSRVVPDLDVCISGGVLHYRGHLDGERFIRGFATAPYTVELISFGPSLERIESKWDDTTEPGEGN